ncbi:MAG: glycosyltransferase, partial [Candidatus Gracilibacteria bacterium]
YVFIRMIFEKMYFREIAQVDEIYTNSTNLQNAIRKYLGRESQIIYPPVDTATFIPTTEKGDYYISFSKLSSLKRVARTVEVFREMPDKKLLVIYGQNDPQKEEIMNLGERYANITFLTLTDNNELPKYIAGAIATIFIAKNEDFGMVALESMSCGVPVIGVQEGGIQETVIDGETGILISAEATKTELISVVQKLDRETALIMQDACIKRAKEFSLENFEKIVKEKFL